MSANANAARAVRRLLVQLLGAVALASCFGAISSGAQAHVTSDPLAGESAASVRHTLGSARRTLRAAHRDLYQAREARRRAVRALHRCQSIRPRHCGVARRSAARAGAQARHARQRFKQAAATVAHARIALLERRAPKVQTAGATVRWKPVAHVSDYVLKRQARDQSPDYSVVKGVSATPTPAAGTTVVYSVRTNVVGSQWSHPVEVSYSTGPGALQASKTSTDKGGGSGHKPTKTKSEPPTESTSTEEGPSGIEEPLSTEEPPVVEEPAASGEEAPASLESTAFQPGLDSGANLELDVQGAEVLRARLVRIEFPVGDAPSQMEPVIAAYAAAGIRVLPLAGFYGSMPTPEQARRLAGWASAFGPGGSFWSSHSYGELAIQDIELGNETSYGYQYGDNAGEPSYQERARTYAIRLKEAAEAIGSTSHHVGLLAQEDDWTGEWANGMFEAVPNLGSYVAGWTIHPYGPDWQGRVEDLIKQTTSHGAPSTIPIDITEWGLATDNGKCLTDNYGWNPCMSYEEAATTLTSTLAEMRAMLGTRLGMFILYQVRDQQLSTATTNEREAYFGALQHELQPKGAFTSAVQHVLSGE